LRLWGVVVILRGSGDDCACGEESRGESAAGQQESDGMERDIRLVGK
jgi:hypothetical protein